MRFPIVTVCGVVPDAAIVPVISSGAYEYMPALLFFFIPVIIVFALRFSLPGVAK